MVNYNDGKDQSLTETTYGVVSFVTFLPRIERSEQRSKGDVTTDIIDEFRIREGTVKTVMAYDKQRESKDSHQTIPRNIS